MERTNGNASTSGAIPTHRLCGSAIAVPTRIPAGRKYQPRTGDGFDFNTGTDLRGWRCLKFSIDHPIYYRYRYRRGTPLVASKSLATGSALLSFEASAQGDLDADRIFSGFAMLRARAASCGGRSSATKWTPAPRSKSASSFATTRVV